MYTRHPIIDLLDEIPPNPFDIHRVVDKARAFSAQTVAAAHTQEERLKVARNKECTDGVAESQLYSDERYNDGIRPPELPKKGAEECQLHIAE